MTTRAHQLHQLARGYVTEALGKGDFDAIPYAEDVVLRAPLCSGGSSIPLVGRAKLREKWWAPLPQLVAGAEVIDTFVNRDLTAVAVEFLCHIRQPAHGHGVRSIHLTIEAGRPASDCGVLSEPEAALPSPRGNQQRPSAPVAAPMPMPDSRCPILSFHDPPLPRPRELGQRELGAS